MIKIIARVNARTLTGKPLGQVMKTSIILLGANGRMGKAIIEAINNNEAFDLSGAVDINPVNSPLDSTCLVGASLEEAIGKGAKGVVVDFSSASASMEAARIASKNNLPIVIGSTGFNGEQLEKLENLAKDSPILRSANMSVGVNVLARFLPLLAKALGKDYDMEIVETHHRHKKDAPSGTALMLAETLAKSRNWSLDEARVSGRDGVVGERKDKEIGVTALRGGDVAGVHDCYFLGTGEIIEVKHIAESRANFAEGALRAAAWLKDMKPGKLYSMEDVIAISDAS